MLLKERQRSRVNSAKQPLASDTHYERTATRRADRASDLNDRRGQKGRRRSAQYLPLFLVAGLLTASPFVFFHGIPRGAAAMRPTAQEGGGMRPSTIDSQLSQASAPLQDPVLHKAAKGGSERPKSDFASVRELRSWADKINGEMRIRNTEKFASAPLEVVIAIQIHSRLPELRTLLESLRAVQGIEDALLILSHDHFADDIIAEVERVDFCQVLQLFFPYSNQLHPDTFPGTDSRDCPRDTVVKNGCIGEPDQYGHYRETKFTATKHHWWWKLNFLFSNLSSLKSGGRVVLLEEDHMVAPDLLTALHGAEAIREAPQAAEAQMVVLGAYFDPGRATDVGQVPAKFAKWKDMTGKATLLNFNSVQTNMGMVIDRKLYVQLLGCTEAFCTWPDYNWDWSFQALQRKCDSFGGSIRVVQLDAARVFHAGDCNGMHQNSGCTNAALVDTIRKNLFTYSDNMFPDQIQISHRIPPINGPPQYANGGWGDPRDQQLCKFFSGQAEVPIGTAPMQHAAPLSQISVQEAPARAEVSASRVHVPEATVKAHPVNLGQANPSVGFVSSFMNGINPAVQKLLPSASKKGSPTPDHDHSARSKTKSRRSGQDGVGASSGHRHEHSAPSAKDATINGEGLGIDPWARSSSSSDKQLAFQVTELLQETEIQELKALCGRCLYHTITTAVALRGLGQDAHVSTGDIPDMWLRDSAFEIAVYMPRMVSRPSFRLAVEGTIRRHAFDIHMDPYACGFSWKWWDPNTEVNEFNRRQGRGGWVAIRSFEIDSGAYFMNLLWDYFKTPGLYRPEALIGETLIHDAVSYMVNTYITEQSHHEYSPYIAHDLPNGGKGSPVGYTGMVWSGYRASDDATKLGYNIPDNMFLAGALERMIALNDAVWGDSDLSNRMQQLLDDINSGLDKFAAVERDGQTVYAYEVDGLGNQLVDFDDPNIPSLMSIPLLGYSRYDEKIYRATRDRLFNHNPYYVRGSQFQGWASPHTPAGQVWHLGWITQGLTSQDPKERVDMLRNLLAAQCGNGLMHETVNVNMAARCTRKWFEWANAMLVVYVENSLGVACDQSADSEFNAKILQRESREPRHFSSALFYENMEQHIHHADRWDSTKLTDNIVRR